MDFRYHYASLLDVLALPLTGLFSGEVGARHGVGSLRKLQLSYQARRAQLRVPTASTFVEHLAMAESVLRVDPSVPGVVIECGCWKGGSTASLSLACRLTNRRLLVFDSFAGLPEPREGDAEHHIPRDRATHTYERGAFSATLDEVRSNVARFGAIEACQFVPGYFEQTLPALSEPCVFAFVDVDLTDSVKTCLTYIWPRLADGCELWTHEAHHAEIADLFFDDEWWKEALGVPAPGLIGAGSGLNLSHRIETPIGYAIKNPEVSHSVKQDWPWTPA
jgi:macrocin-O-methyltransferase TylF-like protien